VKIAQNNPDTTATFTVAEAQAQLSAAALRFTDLTGYPPALVKAAYFWKLSQLNKTQISIADISGIEGEQTLIEAWSAVKPQQPKMVQVGTKWVDAAEEVGTHRVPLPVYFPTLALTNGEKWVRTYASNLSRNDQRAWSQDVRLTLKYDPYPNPAGNPKWMPHRDAQIQASQNASHFASLNPSYSHQFVACAIHSFMEKHATLHNYVDKTLMQGKKITEMMQEYWETCPQQRRDYFTTQMKIQASAEEIYERLAPQVLPNRKLGTKPKEKQALLSQIKKIRVIEHIDEFSARAANPNLVDELVIKEMQEAKQTRVSQLQASKQERIKVQKELNSPEAVSARNATIAKYKAIGLEGPGMY
jgi:hypothetical protein